MVAKMLHGASISVQPDDAPLAACLAHLELYHTSHIRLAISLALASQDKAVSFHYLAPNPSIRRMVWSAQP